MNQPSATYRVQLNSSFTFKDLSSIIEYLHLLGISTIYAAPITTSEKDSAHGYDVTDSMQINPQIGTLKELKQLSERLKQLGMNWLQDIVPNHMAFSTDNYKLMDVLERGDSSPYYQYFDINWKHPDAPGQLLIPTLGSELNQTIEAGEIKIVFNEHGFSVNYFDTNYPLSISALSALILSMHQQNLPADLIHKIETYRELSINKSLDEWISIKETFTETISSDRDYMKIMQLFLEALNKDTTALKALIKQQYYLLSFWKTSETKMNYRRFFTVNSLICLRMEEEAVFKDYHTFLFSLYKENIIQGLRLDHIDGLYDPLNYIKRLRQELGDDSYIIAEKILEYNEDLAKDWHIEGTSGYEFLAFTNRILTDQNGAEYMLQFYQEFTGKKEVYQDIVYDKKHAFLYSQMQGELDNLMNLLQESDLIKEQNFQAIRKALGVFMAAFPLYRIYPDHFPLTEEALHIVQIAYEKALQKEGNLKQELTFIKELFGNNTHETNEQKLTFIRRLMQFTGPLAAKGVEDTTFYLYNPLISHNEVGDAPSPLAISIEEFHEKMISRQANNPYSLNATSTHDTKRGEDARMRINVLSHFPEEWKQKVNTWHEANAAFIKQKEGRSAPSLNDEYFIYQSLLGSFPEGLIPDEAFLERSNLFITKALREAKTETTYTEPDTWYEEACIEFIQSILKPEHAFLTSFIPFLETVMNQAALYSVIQTVIKTTAPGIPDIYQGSELWELSYVDPDNRRPVDYGFRKELLNTIIEKEKEGTSLFDFLTENRTKGAEKLFATWKMLSLRKKYTEVFSKGTYVPIQVVGQNKGKLLAYLRHYEQQYILVVLPLHIDYHGNNYSKNSWNDILLQIPQELPSEWKNVFTNERISSAHTLQVSAACATFPVAVFENA